MNKKLIKISAYAISAVCLGGLSSAFAAAAPTSVSASASFDRCSPCDKDYRGSVLTYAQAKGITYYAVCATGTNQPCFTAEQYLCTYKNLAVTTVYTGNYYWYGKTAYSYEYTGWLNKGSYFFCEATGPLSSNTSGASASAPQPVAGSKATPPPA